MKKTRKYLTLWAIGAAAVLTATALTAATYAWFTSNRKVETEKVTARTGTVSLELQISRTGGDKLSTTSKTDKNGNAYTEADLRQRGENEKLMPVSTENLKTFIYSPVTDEGVATEQTLRILHSNVEEEKETAEKLYYHDTLYLRLEDKGSMPEDTKANLYLDNLEDLPIVQPHENSKLLNAARLGLTIDDANPLILRFTEDAADAMSNTALDGEQLKTGLVLVEKGGSIVPSEENPSHPLKDYQYSSSNTVPTPLMTMKLKTTYKVDIYFYLEGCDPDCTGEVETHKADLALAFYAALV